jgi:hypothetical protein
MYGVGVLERGLKPRDYMHDFEMPEFFNSPSPVADFCSRLTAWESSARQG